MHSRAEAFRRRAADQVGFEPNVRELPQGTKTASDAAAAIDCALEQIVKSMVMLVENDPVLVLTSGTNRVDESALADACGVDTASIGIADPEEVKSHTGWSIGGVPPFAHDTPLRTFVDPTLLEYEAVWAGAGTPSAVFPIEPDRLVEVTDAAPLESFHSE